MPRASVNLLRVCIEKVTTYVCMTRSLKQVQMARCECPFERNLSENDSKSFSSSRQIVLRQLRSTSCKTRKRRFKVWLEECKFELVRNVVREMGGVPVDSGSPWVLAWVDGTVPHELFPRMNNFQKLNHFPGMGELCKKDLLAANLQRMKRLFPAEYSFFPTTFRLPAQTRELGRYCERRGRRSFLIVKPERSCQGAGIQILPATGDLRRLTGVVCQRYIEKPLLMDGLKFDVRLYVLVTSVCPLRLYLYEEGLVRLATVPYQPPSASNLHEKRMHLTNYAINRNSGGDSCKRSLSELESLLEERGLERGSFHASVERLVVLCVVGALPVLERTFAASFPGLPACSPCFELLGFDVLLDSHARPHLLEVNRSPSLGGSTALDRATKRGMVRTALEMVLPTRRQVALLVSEQHLKARRRLANLNLKHPTARERVVAESALERERGRAGRFRPLFPAPDDRYDRFLLAARQ